MTTEELHEIYVWAWDAALRSIGVSLISEDNVLKMAEVAANARIAWVNAKAEELSA